MSQNRPHPFGSSVTYVVVMASIGGMVALGLTTDSYGLPPWPYWSDMTEADKILLVIPPCIGALLGAFVVSLIAFTSAILRQTSTSEAERPRSYSLELPEYTPDGRVDLENQTREQPEPHTSSKVPRDSAPENLSTSGVDTDSPRVPPPSYTPDNRSQRRSVQTSLPSYSSIADGSSGAFRRD